MNIKKDKTLIISTIAIILSMAAISMQIFVFATQKPDNEEFYRDTIKEHQHNFSAPLPKELTLCGEQVPLDNIFVREALDRELTLLMYQHNSTFLVMKRAWRYFPEIEQYLKDNSAPEDLKYLAVAESALSDVASPAKAEGFWQFMSATAKQYNLVVTEEYDERYNLQKSTTAAASFLKGLRNRLGSWALACAAYNCGEGGLKARINEQGIKNYWQLALNNETSRYVYRILAYKILMQDPQQYGFYLRKQDAYQPLKYEIITVDSTISSFYDFSQKISLPYKYFRLLNPEYRAKKLTNKEKKVYTFRKPTDESMLWSNLVKNIDNPTEYIESL